VKSSENNVMPPDQSSKEEVIIININNKAPDVLMTRGFIATLDVSDFIISVKTKIGNLTG
jgi:hypothetical protein